MSSPLDRYEEKLAVMTLIKDKTTRETEPYQHTQIGYAIIILFALIEVGSIGAYIRLRDPGPLLVFLLISLVETIFFSLTVTVNEAAVRLRFGIGLIRKTIPLRDVTACFPVRNSPLCGWGIRYIGGGWLYNVSGLDAIEVTLRDGRKIRIGTDDPQGLMQAIQNGKQ